MARGSRNIKIELEQVQIEVDGIVEQSIIDNCPSPQCKEYMINKNKEHARRKIYKAFDEAINEIYFQSLEDAPYNAPRNTGTLHKSKLQRIKCDTCRHHISTVYQDKYVTIRRCTAGHETPRRGCLDYVEE